MNVQSKSVNGGMLSLPHVPAPGNQHQVDIGNYQIFIGDTKVGEVWVDIDPNNHDPAFTIEYWCLFSSYVQPSSTQQNVGLSFRYTVGLHSSLSDFQAFARRQQAL